MSHIHGDTSLPPRHFERLCDNLAHEMDVLQFISAVEVLEPQDQRTQSD